MASERSEQVLALLRELAALKELDQAGGTPITSESIKERHERRRRRSEIRSQIKQLAKNKTSS